MTVASAGELLDLAQVGDEAEPTFRSPAQTGPQFVFGGQFLGQGLAAAARTVATDRRANSLHAYFLQRGDLSEPVDYRVAALRDGASSSARAVTAHQPGRTLFTLTSTFQQPRDAGWTHQPEAPRVPAADELPSLLDSSARLTGSTEWSDRLEEHFALDIRFVSLPPRLAMQAGADEAAGTTFWVRTAQPLGDDPAVHEAAVAYISDLFLLSSALQPHRAAAAGRPLTVLSLDHALWLHRACRADDWILYVQQGVWTGSGRGLARGHMFASDGACLASVMQEGIVAPALPRDSGRRTGVVDLTDRIR